MMNASNVANRQIMTDYHKNSYKFEDFFSSLAVSDFHIAFVITWLEYRQKKMVKLNGQAWKMIHSIDLKKEKKILF